MTYDQYWYGDTSMVKAYREADKLRQERMNTEAWLQGMYIYDLLTRACPLPVVWVDGKNTKPRSYIKEPYQLFGEPQKEENNEFDDGMTKEERELLIAKIALDNERRARNKKI